MTEAWLDTSEYPFESHFIAVDGGRLAGVFDCCDVSVYQGVCHFIAEELGERVVPEVGDFLGTSC